MTHYPSPINTAHESSWQELCDRLYFMNTLQNRDLSIVRISPNFDYKIRVALLIILLSKVRPM